MVAAKLIQGPFDGEVVSLPEPFPIYTIPDFSKLIVVSWIYLLAGDEDDLYFYLHDGLA